MEVKSVPLPYPELNAARAKHYVEKTLVLNYKTTISNKK